MFQITNYFDISTYTSTSSLCIAGFLFIITILAVKYAIEMRNKDLPDNEKVSPWYSILAGILAGIVVVIISLFVYKQIANQSYSEDILTEPFAPKN